jgi:YD repeat-containing protein
MCLRPFVLLFLLVAESNSLFSQNLPQIIPPSPEASALGKYGEIPVGYNTGVPSIEIPLYSYNGKEITIPIGISYHASGLRVNETATWLGLGWILNASGVITRTVQGIPDELRYNNDYVLLENYYNGLLPEPLHERSGVPNNAPDFRLDAYNTKYYDLEPDLYHYNFLGRSGKIIFDKNRNPILLPHQDLSIHFKDQNNPIAGFIITDEKGFRYFFDATEYTETITATSNESAITGWFLSKVSVPGGEEVFFSYNNVQYDSHQRSQSYNYIYQGESGSCGGPGESLNTSYVQFRAFTRQLSQITSSNNLLTVAFFAGTPRDDSSFGQTLDARGNRLDSIVVKQVSGQNIRKFSFGYDYFGTVQDNNKRLKLASVSESNTGLPPKVHRFIYFENQVLPKLSSFKIDHWGLYNNNGANTIIPRTYYVGLRANGNHYSMTLPLTYTGADREPDSILMKACMLRKIEYPTGGITEFEYEPHDYDKTFSGNNLLNADKRKYSPAMIFVVPEINPGQIVVDEEPFYVGRFQRVTGSFSFVFPQGYENSGGTYVSVKILDAAGTALFESTPPQQNGAISVDLPQGNYRLQVKCAFQLSGFNASASLNYEKEEIVAKKIGGGLRIRKIINIPFEGGIPLYRRFLYENSPGVSSGILLGDVSYLSKIDYDNSFNVGGAVNNCFSAELLISSSMNDRVDVNAVSSVLYNSITVLEGDHKTTITYYDDFVPPILHLNYGRCVRLPGLAGCLYDFINTFLPGSKVPSMVFNASSPLNETLWVKQGNDYFKIKETTNSYKTKTLSSKVMGYQLKPVLRYRSDFPGILPVTAYAENFYFYSPFWLSLDKTIEVNYSSQFPGDLSRAVVTETSYQYSTTHLQPVTIVQRNGVRSNIIRRKYPLDYSSVPVVSNPITEGEKAAQGLRLLQEKHIINSPIEEYQHVKEFNVSGQVVLDSIVSGTLYSYRPDKPLLNTVYNLELKEPAPRSSFSESGINNMDFTQDLRYESKFSINQYDASGNILQMQKDKGYEYSFIWDYNATYPIAEVKNSISTATAYTSFESDGLGNFNFDRAYIVNTAASTGKKAYSFNGANLLTKSGLISTRTYIVSYRTKNTTAFSIAGTQAGYPISSQVIGMGGWKYFEHRVSGQAQITIGGNGLIDELRVYPVNAQMTTYTYDPGIGITSATDANNQTVYYDYDKLGRLITVKDSQGKILKTYVYSYKQAQP